MSRREILVDQNENENLFFFSFRLPEKFKQAIRVMRRMKFFVARRKFQEARKPSDMTELVKQTAEDNQALMIKLKDLQRR